MEIKILHTADLHLREYQDNRWKTLQTLIEIGKKEKVEIFIISGDLFDKEIDAETLKPKVREIFSNNGFKIILIPGNHDSEAYAPGMYFGEDTVILTVINRPFEYKNLMIWGLPFESMEREEILYKLRLIGKNLPKNRKNILLYHGELLDAVFSRKDFGEEGEERYMPIKLSYFKDLNFDYILAGHFHSKFNTWKLENGGYFVYPGSPISITRKETGRRKVNLFKIGEPPKEYFLDTPHFEEISIDLDPFTEKHPLEIIKEHLEKVHDKAKIILRVRGYINSEKINVNESEFVRQIKEITKEKFLEEEHFEFRDISRILEDDLFKRFREKLEQSDYDEEKKKQLCDVAIKGMMKVKS